jgi:spore maturation protein CgeB
VRIVIFCHSLVSDWNHGNAHFLRGLVQELLSRGDSVRVFEPEDSWSRANLLKDHGPAAIDGFASAYPELRSETYRPGTLDVSRALAGADLVLVHEWTDPSLVARVGQHRRDHGSYVLFFHDTHHRSVTDPAAMAVYDLTHYDGVLAFGDSVRDTYLARGWARRAWTWHEAADTRVFHPRPRPRTFDGDVVWIGNWGDEERTAELEAFLFEPVVRLGLRAAVFGVRYPDAALRRLSAAGIEYRGWLPNHAAPDVFARYKATVHVPRRPYLDQLPGVPTIRPFEALACAIPLVVAQWDQTAGLFTPGRDFLVAYDTDQMTSHLAAVTGDERLGYQLAAHGLATIMDRHTCAHRVNELAAIYNDVRFSVSTTHRAVTT